MTEPQYFLKKVSTGAQTPLGALVKIGRGEDNDLKLGEGQASRRHAQILAEESSVFVEDLGSTNGTFVNGRRLDPRVRTRLASGDRVRFDVEEFEFVAPPAPHAGEGDKTVFRPPPPDKTVFRPAATPSPTATPSPAAAPPPPATPPPADRAPGTPPASPAETPPRKGVPKAFLDPSSQATVFIDPKQAKAAVSAMPAPAHRPGDRPYLWVASGERAGQKLELKPLDPTRRVWRVGSGAECELRLEEAGISAKHATLRNEKDTWQVVDEMSVNGTFVNDKRILKSYLADGDRVRFGPVECVFRLPAPAADAGQAKLRWRKYGLIAAIACALTLILVFVLLRVSHR